MGRPRTPRGSTDAHVLASRPRKFPAAASLRDDTVSHIPAETSDRRSRHASSRDSEIIARRLSTGTAVNRRHASVQKSATHAQKDKEKENLGNPVLGQEPRRDPDDARRAGLSGLAGGDIDAGRRMSTYVGRCITRSLARSIVVTRVTRTQLCARETGKSRGPRETASRWFEPTSQHRRGRRRRDERAARHVRPARVTGAIPIPRAPRRGCRRRASDDARRRLPVHHHRKPAHEAASQSLRRFLGAGGATLPAEARQGWQRRRRDADEAHEEPRAQEGALRSLRASHRGDGARAQR